MEIIVSAFAALVAAGCFIAIITSDLAESDKAEKVKQQPGPAARRWLRGRN